VLKLPIALLLTGAVGLAASVGAFESTRSERAEAQTTYYANGQLQSECGVADGRRHGTYRRWTADGVLVAEGRFEHGEKSGDWTCRLPDGTLDEALSGVWRDGVRIAD